MTLREREENFIQECRLLFPGPMTFETEQLLRYGFMRGAQELQRAGFNQGQKHQREVVLTALGVPMKGYDP